MIYYFFGTKSGCVFFNWFQRKLKIKSINELKPAKRNTAISVFLELILLLWTFYLVLLFAYDNNFFGEKYIVTYIIFAVCPKGIVNNTIRNAIIPVNGFVFFTFYQIIITGFTVFICLFWSFAEPLTPASYFTATTIT